jgi:hypothetical protein
MQYILLIYGDEKLWEARTEEQLQELYAGYGKLNEELRAQGKLAAGDELAPTATATTVQVKDGETIVSDGPFADTKEVLGGYYLVEAPDLDAALELAARGSKACRGKVEVRPFHGE